jgi:hypothetical protein
MSHLPYAPSAALVAALAAVLGLVSACEAPPGDVVTCTQEWSCELNGVVSDNVDTFCTDPNDEDRAADITAYQAEFAETCDSVNIDCGGGVFATCAATCATGGGACDIATAVRVRLD